MSFITSEVKKKSNEELSHMRLLAKPCPEGNQNIALFYEVWNEIRSLQIEIAESKALKMCEKTRGLNIYVRKIILQSPIFKQSLHYQQSFPYLFVS